MKWEFKDNHPFGEESGGRDGVCFFSTLSLQLQLYTGLVVARGLSLGVACPF